MWATNYTIRPAILRIFAVERNERSQMVIFWTDSHCYTSSSRFIPAGYRTKAFKVTPAILGWTAGHHWSILMLFFFVMFDAVEMHTRFEVRATKWVLVRLRIDFWWLFGSLFPMKEYIPSCRKSMQKPETSSQCFSFCISHGICVTSQHWHL